MPLILFAPHLPSSITAEDWAYLRDDYAVGFTELDSIVVGGTARLAVIRSVSGDTCKIIRSVDNFKTSTITNLPYAMRAGAYNAGKYVLVGYNGMSYYSTDDGLTWTQTTIHSGRHMNVVVWNAEEAAFVAAGDWGSVYTSPDGITWTHRHTAGTSASFSWLAGASDRYNGCVVLVGVSSGTGQIGRRWAGATGQATSILHSAGGSLDAVTQVSDSTWRAFGFAGAIVQSTNYAGTWTAGTTTPALPAANGGDAAASGGRRTDGRCHVARGGGIWRSGTALANTYTAVTQMNNAYASRHIIDVDANEMFEASVGGIRRSIDGGATWKEVFSCLKFFHALYSPKLNRFRMLTPKGFYQGLGLSKKELNLSSPQYDFTAGAVSYLNNSIVVPEGVLHLGAGAGRYFVDGTAFNTYTTGTTRHPKHAAYSPKLERYFITYDGGAASYAGAVAGSWTQVGAYDSDLHVSLFAFWTGTYFVWACVNTGTGRMYIFKSLTGTDMTMSILDVDTTNTSPIYASAVLLENGNILIQKAKGELRLYNPPANSYTIVSTSTVAVNDYITGIARHESTLYRTRLSMNIEKSNDQGVSWSPVYVPQKPGNLVGGVKYVNGMLAAMGDGVVLSFNPEGVETAAVDPMQDQVVLSIPFAEAPGSTSFADYRGHTVTTAVAATASGGRHGTCGQFTTSGARAQATAAEFAPGTGDFTLDFVAKPTAITSSVDRHYVGLRGATEQGFSVVLTPAGYWTVMLSNGTTLFNNVYKTRAEHEIVRAVRKSGVLSLSVNGYVLGRVAYSTSVTDTTVTIGARYIDNAGQWYTALGTISDVRLTKAARDPEFVTTGRFADTARNKVLFLGLFNGAQGAQAAVDSSPAANAITFSGALALDTVAPAFGSACLKSPSSASAGNGARVLITPEMVVRPYEDFTFEFMRRKDAVSPGTVTLHSGLDVADNSCIHFGNSGGDMVCTFVARSGATRIIEREVPDLAPVGTWQYIAVERRNGVITYQQGDYKVVVGSNDAAASWTPFVAGQYLTFLAYGGQNSLYRSVDNVRLSKGSLFKIELPLSEYVA